MMCVFNSRFGSLLVYWNRILFFFFLPLMSLNKQTLNLLKNLQQLSCIVETVTHLLKMTTTVYLCWQKHLDLPLEEQLTLVTR